MKDYLIFEEETSEETTNTSSTKAEDSTEQSKNNSAEQSKDKTNNSSDNALNVNIAILKAMNFKGTSNKKIFNGETDGVKIKIQLESAIKRYVNKYKEPSFKDICKHIILENQNNNINAKISFVDSENPAFTKTATIILDGDGKNIRNKIAQAIKKFKGQINGKKDKEILDNIKTKIGNFSKDSAEMLNKMILTFIE